MSKTWNPLVPVKKTKRLTPEQVAKGVLKSPRLIQYIEAVSTNDDRKKMTLEVVKILHEIAYDKQTIALRLLGSLTTYLTNQIYTSILINEKSLRHMKSTLGNEQVLYLPSHRSYVDFIMVSYVFFSFDLEIPVVAAGMDFHAMMGLGEMMRKTGAFFMRRTFVGNSFYWKVFKEYMHELMTANDTGTEFFIEGTRSRSFKALTPKTGLLTMALEPYFMGELHDIKVVPISVSYEKPLEEQLFVYELLGIPKPKESTMGFLKAITNLKNQNYGKICMDFGEPMSVKEYFNDKVDRFKHSHDPVHVQQLDKDEIQCINDLANEVLRKQQDKIVIMPFNIIAMIYNELTFTNKLDEISLSKVIERMREVGKLFVYFGAILSMDERHEVEEIKSTLKIHSNILDDNFHLIKSNVNLNNMNASKLKGHRFSNETMNIAVPVFSLQLYINPMLYWLAQPAFLVLAALQVKKHYGSEISIEHLKEESNFLRQIFGYEFVLYQGFTEDDFHKTLTNLINLKVFNKHSNNDLELNMQSNYIDLLLSSVSPFVNCYSNAGTVISRDFERKEFSEKEVFTAIQANAEKYILNDEPSVHPHALSLDSINLAVLSLVNNGCLFKEKINSLNVFTNNQDNLYQMVHKLNEYNSLLPFNYKYFDVEMQAKL
ncbi:unnamed protein product [Diamesa serratosioi]